MTEIVQMLEDSRRQLVEAARGAPEPQAAAPAEGGRWSILQCLEHVTFTERRFLGLIENAELREASVVDAEKEAMLSARVVDRSTKVNAPERAHPQGVFTSLEQALSEFNATRDKCVAFAAANAGRLDRLLTSHPRFGETSGTGMLRIVAGHALRHAEQIREIRAEKGA